MPFTRITLLNGGHCSQLGYFAGRAAPGLTTFQAVFLLLEHETHGIHLIDTGYSAHFFQATQKLPQRLYRWTTPVHLAGDARSILAARGIHADDVRSIFISHFHGDHIAGLRCFDRATFVYRREAYELLKQKRALGQVAHGFLADLLPPDFEARSVPLAEPGGTSHEMEVAQRKQERPANAIEQHFNTHDYFGDGELLLVDLPGHSPGHTGFAMRTESERILYIADATWDMDAMLRSRRLPAAARWFQHSIATYEETQAKLRAFHQAHPDWTMLACHCPRTQSHAGCH